MDEIINMCINYDMKKLFLFFMEIKQNGDLYEFDS